MEKVIVRVQKTDTGYCSGTDMLPGFVVTCEKFQELEKEFRESLEFYVHCAKKAGDDYPAILDGEFELEYQFDVESLLCFYDGIFTRAALERVTGINQKQLAHYALGLHKPRPAQEKKIKDALRKLGKELAIIA
ncbi:MAG: hypothetical protein LBP56_05215 [Odoribacteraceae bacterium]|jgi:hypothetical protein|nr:hypothetical protein [Odoribacteraceae bacterium]